MTFLTGNKKKAIGVELRSNRVWKRILASRENIADIAAHETKQQHYIYPFLFIGNFWTLYPVQSDMTAESENALYFRIVSSKPASVKKK